MKSLTLNSRPESNHENYHGCARLHVADCRGRPGERPARQTERPAAPSVWTRVSGGTKVCSVRNKLLYRRGFPGFSPVVVAERRHRSAECEVGTAADCESAPQPKRSADCVSSASRSAFQMTRRSRIDLKRHYKRSVLRLTEPQKTKTPNPLNSKEDH